jgi:hypothetical protein
MSLATLETQKHFFLQIDQNHIQTMHVWELKAFGFP